MKKVLLSLSAVLVLLTSCAEEPSGPNCPTAKFSWKEDGTHYEGATDVHLNSSFDSYYITACTGSANPANVNFRFYPPVSVGTYTLGHIQQATSAFKGDASYFDTGGGSYFTTDSTHTGSVIVTAVNDSAITGTFSMTVYRYSTSTTHVITEGQFTAIK